MTQRLCYSDLDLVEMSRLTAWDLLLEAVRARPDHDAVVFGATTLSYRELHDQSLQCAAALEQLGVGSGSRVATLFHSSSDWAVLHFGLSRLGAIVVPLSLAFEAAEIEHVFQVAAPEHLIAVRDYRGRDYAHLFDSRRVSDGLSSRTILDLDSEGLVDRASDGYRKVFDDGGNHGIASAAPRADDIAYVIFTSGATGSPKAAFLRHGALSAAGGAYVLAMAMDERDRLMLMLPTYHVTGPVQLALTAAVAACAHMLGHFDAERALDAIENGRCTCTTGFPTNITRILGAANFDERDTSSMRSMLLGGTSAWLQSVYEQFGLEHISGVYGSTECAGILSCADPADGDLARWTSTSGRPVAGMEVKIVDPETDEPCPPNTGGEICFRGILTFDGYLGETNRPFDEEGFFHSGDYGSLDEAGYLTYRGRYKMMVKTGGENVSEFEVEMSLQQYDEIELIQVVGVPDDHWGEVIVGFVQFAANRRIELDEVRRRSEGQLARFKVPKLLIPTTASEWPVLPNGKIDKATLRDRARERYGDAVNLNPA